jgi:hypothetical protein
LCAVAELALDSNSDATLMLLRSTALLPWQSQFSFDVSVLHCSGTSDCKYLCFAVKDSLQIEGICSYCLPSVHSAAKVAGIASVRLAMLLNAEWFVEGQRVWV